MDCPDLIAEFEKDRAEKKKKEQEKKRKSNGEVEGIKKKKKVAEVRTSAVSRILTLSYSPQALRFMLTETVNLQLA